MYLVLLGPPGSGKGTQAQRLIQRFDIPHISTGAVFRAAYDRGLASGIEAKKYMDAGTLVPDDLVLTVTRERLSQPDCAKGFVLDGFPRTLLQGEELEMFMADVGKKLTKVVNIVIPEAKFLERAIGRRFCKVCGATYHITFNPPIREGFCDKDGGELFQRDDDTEITVKRRIIEYRKLTWPLAEYYHMKRIYVPVDGLQSISKVFADITTVLKMDTL